MTDVATQPIPQIPASTDPTKDRKRKKARSEKWDTYIHTILDLIEKRRNDNVHFTIDRRCMKVLNSLQNSLFAKFARAVQELRHVSGRSTLSENDIYSAAKLILQPDRNNTSICDSACANAKMAVERYRKATAEIRANIPKKERQPKPAVAGENKQKKKRRIIGIRKVNTRDMAEKSRTKKKVKQPADLAATDASAATAPKPKKATKKATSKSSKGNNKA